MHQRKYVGIGSFIYIFFVCFTIIHTAIEIFRDLVRDLQHSEGWSKQTVLMGLNSTAVEVGSFLSTAMVQYRQQE